MRTVTVFHTKRERWQWEVGKLDRSMGIGSTLHRFLYANSTGRCSWKAVSTTKQKCQVLQSKGELISKEGLLDNTLHSQNSVEAEDVFQHKTAGPLTAVAGQGLAHSWHLGSIHTPLMSSKTENYLPLLTKGSTDPWCCGTLCTTWD